MPWSLTSVRREIDPNFDVHDRMLGRASNQHTIQIVVLTTMQQLIDKIKAFAQEKPIVTFVIALVAINVVLGIGAFAYTSSAAATEEEVETTDEDEEKEEEEKEKKPTKTPRPTKTPAPTDEPEEDETETSEDDEDTESNESESDEETTESDGDETNTDESSDDESTEEQTNKKNINLFGDLFADNNCNGSRDSGEEIVGTVAKVTIINLSDDSTFATVSTNNAGHYSYSGSIGIDEVVELRPQVSVPSGYQLPPDFAAEKVTFSNNNASGQVLLPLVPDDAADSCTE